MLVAVLVFCPNYAQIMLAFQNYATFLKNYSELQCDTKMLFLDDTISLQALQKFVVPLTLRCWSGNWLIRSCKGTFFTLVTLLVPLLLYFPVVDSRRLSRASCAGFGLSSLFSLPCKLSGCKFTALDWFGVAAAILKRALGERLRSLGPRHRLPVPFQRTPAVSQHNVN